MCYSWDKKKESTSLKIFLKTYSFSKFQLEKMTETGDHTQAMDLLQRLTDIDMNLSILTNTRIGKICFHSKASSKVINNNFDFNLFFFNFNNQKNIYF